jgi:histidinol-phosphate aminotransferase
LFLCNPNNPTGRYLPEQDVTHIVKAAGDTLVVLDEAYIAFTENTWSSINLLQHDNVIILRSMTKDYALAGLRLGYALAALPVISVLKQVRPPWNVNAVAQQAGVQVLHHDDYLTECGKLIAEARDFLIEELNGLGLTTVPSQTNFFLVKVGNAAGIRKSLLNKGFLVRDCTSFGLPDYIRLAPRTMPECQSLISAIKELMS